MTTEETPSEAEAEAAAETETEAQAPRRRVRSGATALIAALILVLWVVLAVWMLQLRAGNDVAAVIATVLGVASVVVIPLLALAILVFAIIALLLNAVPGKIMGALAIVLPLLTAALYWNYIGGFSASFSFS
jgi:hypothetical protein